MKEFTFGALPSKPDERDYTVCAIPRAFPVPFVIDMDENFKQIYGTCTVQAGVGVYRERLGIRFGVGFPYGGARNHTMQGLYPNELATFVCKYGLAPYKDDPVELEVPKAIDYYNANRTRLEAAAKPYAGGQWGRAHTVNEIKAAVFDGLPVMVCVAVEQYGTDNLYRWPCRAAVLGYHELLVIGWKMVNGVEMAVMYNSWGTAWGNKGECYMNWSDVLMLDDIIVLTPPKLEGNQEKNITVRRTLRKGMSGADVKALQQLLISLGYALGKWDADGDFGDATEKAVMAYQRDRGLKDDGVVGDNTWRVLDGEVIDADGKKNPFTPGGLMAVFIAYLLEQVAIRSIYVLGAQGQIGDAITEAWIRKRETKKANAERAIAMWKKRIAEGYGAVFRAHDCSGLGMYFIQNIYKLHDSDLTANGMRSLCKEITRAELRAGDWVFRVENGEAHHIGYLVNAEKDVVHAKGRDDGVVLETLNQNGASYWNWYGRPTVFDGAEPGGKRDLKLGMKGEDVKTFQERLLVWGYDLGPTGADGDYGSKTDAAQRLLAERAAKVKAGVVDEAMRILLGL